MSKSQQKKLFLIDGSALAYRTYFAFIRNPLINSKGENTSAVYGFVVSLLSILEKEKPDYLAVVFDTKEPTFRHKMYAEYKATRQKMPDEMAEQLPRIHQAVEALNVPILLKPGFEADDIMGALAKKAESKGIVTYLVTGDKDFMQLVSEQVFIYNPKSAGAEPEILDVEGVEKKLGLPPSKVIDYLGLMGDSSDNVPGVPGIGPKTALQLLQDYGSLENVLANAKQVKKKNVRESLLVNADKAYLSKELVTLHTDVPMELDIDRLAVGEPDLDRVVPLFQELEFSRLVDRFSKREKFETDYQTVLTENELDVLVESMQAAGRFSMDLETTEIDPISADIVGLSFSWQEGQAYYVPLQLPKSSPVSPLSKELVFSKLKPLLKDEKLKKTGQNIKYDILVLAQHGVNVRGIEFDTMVAAYLLNPSARRLNIDTLSLEYLNFKKIPTSELIGKGKKQISMAEVALEKICDYACEDADIAWRLRQKLAPKLEETDMRKLLDEVEIPLISVLMKMEQNGVALDDLHLAAMSKDLHNDLKSLEQRIYKLAGKKFNINSTKQLATVLFEDLGLPKGRRTKTGYSTDVSVLEELAKKHELPKILLDYRQLTKLKSTYVDALPKLINPKTGRVHTSFNQTITATGRLSSSDPNLQNIPIRTKVGRRIRKAFIPGAADHVILDADYSQIELRIMAHLSQDEALIESFRNDEDVHRRTAAMVFDLPLEEVTEDHRRTAKVVNFGIMYGMGAYGLSQRLDISVNEAEEFIHGYFASYPKVHDYMLHSIQEAREKGYVTTMLNRRRYLPEIASENRQVQQFAERTAINTPIQGTAADLIKVAMVRIAKRMAEERLRSKMILQVHDELVFEVPNDEIDVMTKLVRQEMEGAIELRVPVKVDVSVGEDWLAAH